MTAVAASTSISGERRLGALVAGLGFLVAANLRPPLTMVGTPLPIIGTENGLSVGMRGVLAVLSLSAFAVVFPAVVRLANRYALRVPTRPGAEPRGLNQPAISPYSRPFGYTDGW